MAATSNTLKGNDLINMVQAVFAEMAQPLNRGVEEPTSEINLNDIDGPNAVANLIDKSTVREV